MRHLRLPVVLSACLLLAISLLVLPQVLVKEGSSEAGPGVSTPGIFSPDLFLSLLTRRQGKEETGQSKSLSGLSDAEISSKASSSVYPGNSARNVSRATPESPAPGAKAVDANSLEELLNTSLEIHETLRQVLAAMLEGPQMQEAIAELMKSPAIQQALLDTLKSPQGQQSLMEILKTPEMRAFLINLVRQSLFER